ncbi:hypothetical protein AB0C01_26755 [Micromonospora sp. NPDC048905]|uniref:hypothetical protein n=1 Tax=Micromonospora sp. NPDC048905 TaxID=3155494 RepID=UPI0033DEA0D2
MTVTSVACAPWRIAWAERENERRQRAYRDATDAWLRRDDHLTRLRIEAAGFLGCTQPRTGLPVDLDHDELVFRVLPVATLVEAEARHVPGLPSPGPCDFADTVHAALPAGLRVLDTGMAVVTSRRVAFAGREHRREWRYADLLGPAHHPDVPVTLLPVDGRGSAESARPRHRLSGLLVPASAVVNFRFYLTLAATADRAAVSAQVDALLTAHRHARPAPPVSAAPDDAPSTAVRLDRRTLAVAAVATVVFATLAPGTVGPQQAGTLRRAEAATIATGEPIVRNTATRTPSVLGAASPSTPVRPVRPLAAGPQQPAAPVPSAAVLAAPVPTTVPVPLTEPVPTTVPVPFTEPAPTIAPTPSSAPAPSASATPTPAPTPTDPPTAAWPGSPSPTATPDPALVMACLESLLPLVDRLLCPPTGP